MSFSFNSYDMETAGNKSQNISISKIKMAEMERGSCATIHIKKGTNSETYKEL